MQNNRAKILLFIKLILIQNFTFVIYIIIFVDGRINVNFIKLLAVCLTGGWGIGGILYIITTIIYLKIYKLWKSFVFSLLALLFYVFLFQILFFPIYAVYQEILPPLLVGLLSGLCYMYFHSYLKKK